MGILTKGLKHLMLVVVRILTCNPLSDDEADKEAASTFRSRKIVDKVIVYMSSIFDMLDIMNVILDCVFVVRLFQLEDSRLYASILLIGLLFGQAAAHQGTTLLFRDGIDWDPFWIHGKYLKHENERAFSLLYCLIITETSVFLFEDFPSLVTYAHWPVINFPPAPLDTLDNYNVGITALTLAFILVLFLSGIVVSLFRLDWWHWSGRARVWNSCKVVVFLVGCAMFARLVFQITRSAFRFTFQDVREVPSNKILGIEICENVSFEMRYEFCDENVFMVRVALAWFIAAIFFIILLVAPAMYDDNRPKNELVRRVSQLLLKPGQTKSSSTLDLSERTTKPDAAVVDESTGGTDSFDNEIGIVEPDGLIREDGAWRGKDSSSLYFDTLET